MMNQATESPREFRDLAELQVLVRNFESTRLPRKQWDHAAHLAVTMWYVSLLSEAEASNRVVEGIRAYNWAHDIRRTRHSGYHETITFFWLSVARSFRQQHKDASVFDRVNAFVAEYRDRQNLILDYYEPTTLATWEARSSWVSPDRQHLPITWRLDKPPPDNVGTSESGS